MIDPRLIPYLEKGPQFSRGMTDDEFEECEDLWDELKQLVSEGNFTLGKPLEEFEANFANYPNSFITSKNF